MRIYWWNDGLHITGDRQERKLLDAIYQHLKGIGTIEIGWPSDHPTQAKGTRIDIGGTRLTNTGKQSLGQ